MDILVVLTICTFAFPNHTTFDFQKKKNDNCIKQLFKKEIWPHRDKSSGRKYYWYFDFVILFNFLVGFYTINLYCNVVEMVEGLNCNLFCIIEPRTSPLNISIHKLVTKIDTPERINWFSLWCFDWPCSSRQLWIWIDCNLTNFGSFKTIFLLFDEVI